MNAPATRTAPVVTVLRPGEYFVGGAGDRVRTLLGSCVSMTLWSARHRIGAMSHFLLSERGGRPTPNVALDARYGEEALQLMLGELLRRGVKPADCEAKLFGGGNMFPEQTDAPGSSPTVGRRNGEAAQALLQQRQIRVVSASLYGSGHRQIVFDISNGHVWSRQVPPANALGALPQDLE